MSSSSLLSDLAPTGTLRVGINYGNPILAQRDAGSGELRGIAVDLGRELGKRVGAPVELVGFESAGKMFDAVKAGSWDVAFLAVDPGRAGDISFTAPYIEIEGTYLVPAGSSVREVADVDRKGVRVGVSAKSAYDLFLSRSLQHAELVRGLRADPCRQSRRRRRHQAAPRCQRPEASRIARARRPIHGDPTGAGHSEGPRRRGEVPSRIHRGRKSFGVRRPGDREIGYSRRIGRSESTGRIEFLMLTSGRNEAS